MGPQAATEAPPKPTAARTIILPRQLIAGQRGTLAVMDIQGRLTPGAVVELTGGIRVTTDLTGRAGFTVPAKPRVLFAHLRGRLDKVSSVIVPLTEGAEPGPSVLAYSRFAGLTDRFEISGTGFDGDADANHASAGGKAALILASSPVALVLMPAPDLSEGPSEFTVDSRGQSAGAFPITFISLEVSAAKKNLAANERGLLLVRVRGSNERLSIEARNLSPEVVALGHGTIQRAASSGSDENIARFELRGLRGGDFSISVRLVPVMTALGPNNRPDGPAETDAPMIHFFLRPNSSRTKTS